MDPSRHSRQPNHPYLLILIHCRLYRSALWPSTSRSTETTGSAVDKKSWRSSGGVALFLFSSRPCHTSNGIGTSKLPPTFLPFFFFLRGRDFERIAGFLARFEKLSFVNLLLTTKRFAEWLSKNGFFPFPFNRKYLLQLPL